MPHDMNHTTRRNNAVQRFGVYIIDGFINSMCAVKHAVDYVVQQEEIAYYKEKHWIRKIREDKNLCSRLDGLIP